jgi:hypothetical protein
MPGKMRKWRAKPGRGRMVFRFFFGGGAVSYAGTATGRHSGAPSANSALPPASKTWS